MKTRLVLLIVACLLVAMPATAQVNYYVFSSNGVVVLRSPNASSDVVIASTFNGVPVTRLGEFAFYNCTNLTSVTIPHTVTRIEFEPFLGCAALTNLSVDAANPAYSSLDGVLFNKAQTTLIAFPPGRGSYVIPDSVTRIGSSAFVRCAALTNVTIPNSVTNIGSRAFSGCTALANVTIPSSVASLGDEAFSGCTNLTNFTFLGNAPGLVLNGHVGGYYQFFSVGAGAKAYYHCSTTGWGTTYGGLPTEMLCPPQMAPGSVGVKPGGFGFTLIRLTNQTVVEASTDLVNWQPIWTNTPSGASADFVDPEWLNHSNRFYRARSD